MLSRKWGKDIVSAMCLIAVAHRVSEMFPLVIAANRDEFYDRLFNRGMAQFNEGNYANAYSSLRVAAFGLLEDVRRFETARPYHVSMFGAGGLTARAPHSRNEKHHGSCP